MHAVDTDVLVYAASRGSDDHEAALAVLELLSERASPWAIPWPCIYEFLRVTTHPKVLSPPLSMKQALSFVSALEHSPSLILLAETAEHPGHMRRALEEGGTIGNLVFDARIAALCHEHGIRELITADTDFLRFRDLRVIKPREFLEGT